MHSSMVRTAPDNFSMRAFLASSVSDRRSRVPTPGVRKH